MINANSIRILIADRQFRVRSALRLLPSQEPDLTVMDQQQENGTIRKRFQLKDHPWIGTLVIQVLLILGLVVFSLVLTPEQFVGDFTDARSAVVANGILFLIYAALVFLVIPFGLGLPRGRKPFRGYLTDIGLGTLRPLAWLAAVGLSSYLIFAATQLFGSVILDRYVFDIQRILPPASWNLIGAINPGIYEEIIFRGITITLYRTKYSDQKSILYSAGLFGAVHALGLLTDFSYENLVSRGGVVVGAFLIGLFYGYLFIKTRSLLPSMVIHYLGDALTPLWTFLPSAAVEVKALHLTILGIGLVPSILSILWVTFVFYRWPNVSEQRT